MEITIDLNPYTIDEQEIVLGKFYQNGWNATFETFRLSSSDNPNYSNKGLCILSNLSSDAVIPNIPNIKYKILNNG